MHNSFIIRRDGTQEPFDTEQRLVSFPDLREAIGDIGGLFRLDAEQWAYAVTRSGLERNKLPPSAANFPVNPFATKYVAQFVDVGAVYGSAVICLARHIRHLTERPPRTIEPVQLRESIAKFSPKPEPAALGIWEMARVIRRRLKWKQGDMANFLTVNARTYRSWEDGTHEPDRETLARVKLAIEAEYRKVMS